MKNLKKLSLAAFLIAALPLSARAADLRSVLEGYSLTSWSQKDGLPPSVIWTMVQDLEGYLWLGTDAGLVRFDGVHFLFWRPEGSTNLPKTAVRALCVSHDGSIWLGFGEPGGVSRIQKGMVRNYGEADGLGVGAVTMIGEDQTGTIWTGSRAGLFKFEGELWKASGRGLPKSALYRRVVDRRGRELVASADGLFQRAPGDNVFQKDKAVDGVARDVLEDGQTELLVIADAAVGFRGLGNSFGQSVEKGRGSRLLQDSKGNLWVGTLGQGLWRVRIQPHPAPPLIERTTTLNGFSDDGVTSLLEDRDGNIWAATYDGLNRLTPQKLTPVMNLGVISGIESTPHGVLVGSTNALIEFGPGEVTPRHQPQPFGGGAPTAMHADRSGALWIAANQGLFRLDGHIAAPVGFSGQTFDQVNSIAADAHDQIWLSDRDRGVFRLSPHGPVALTLPKELVGAQVMCSYGDRTGRIWFAFSNGQLVAVSSDGAVHLYGPQNGLPPSVYRAIYETGDGSIWLGSDAGLTRFRNGEFRIVNASNSLPEGSVIAILGDDTGNLWLGLEGVGIVRVNTSEIERGLAERSYQIRHRIYDKFDGFAGAPRWFGNNTATRAQDGRLWFASARGVTIVDPNGISDNPVTPVSVSIEGILVDGQELRSSPHLRLPSGTTRVEIDYTVPNVASPMKTRFRYLLEGFDREWTDAGARRQAFYTNLPPRAYRFRVATSNTDGTWNEANSIWDFSIDPRFYQHGWFWAVAAAFLVMLVWGVWRVRIQQVRKQFSLVLGERARLSREVHDTVLQGLCGVAFQCDAIANDVELSPASEIRERLLRLRRNTEEYVREARQSILNLRSPRQRVADLPEALRQAGERAIGGGPIAFKFALSGTPSQGWAETDEQLLRIGQEALVNAVRHASPSEVCVELQYDDSSVVLRVSDDGRGFDPEQVEETEGHCGLLSMKERAEALGGTLRIMSSHGRGVEVEAHVPRG